MNIGVMNGSISLRGAIIAGNLKAPGFWRAEDE